MITKKTQLEEYIRIEKYSANGGTFMREKILPPPSFKYVAILRHLEYHYNNKGIWHRILTLWFYWRYYQISLHTGISIPINVAQKGLTLYHYGSIVVNAATRIGENCCIMNNVNIGAAGGSKKAPRIGNNVYIGPGAVIFGDIDIADGTYIGANAVVNKSIDAPNSVVVGAPGKVVKYDNIHWWQKNKLTR